MKVVKQDYNNCLVNVSNSILKHYGVKTFHNSLKELDEYLEKDYKNVVLILYDGFGSKLIERNIGSKSFLAKHKIKDITSVFPATTTAATTSIVTGLTPIEHCWLGWNLYIASIDKTVTMYWNVLKGTDIKVAEYNVAQREFPYTTIFELINKKDEVSAYCISPYEGVKYDDNNIDEMYSKIKELCDNNEKTFIYAYCAEPDHFMHEVGTTDERVIELMKTLDNKTEKLCDSLEDALIIIVADHGHMTLGEYVFLDDYPILSNMLIRETSLEPRATNFFVKKKMLKAFKKEFDKLFSNDFTLLTKQEVIDKKLFGDGVPHDKFESCLGDYIALAISDKAFVDNHESTQHKGVHAGVTEYEVMIPLIIVDKK